MNTHLIAGITAFCVTVAPALCAWRHERARKRRPAPPPLPRRRSHRGPHRRPFIPSPRKGDSDKDAR
ncbi:hypothetical protein AB0A77_28520 [Streptomyces varsoviensis]|uniref:hypothetical protein n=1 Tax=Streptomyces varsoviensis TaxID=67373 RepID=UPI00340D4840